MMDIGNQRHALICVEQLLLDFCQGFGMCHTRHGNADDFTANFMKTANPRYGTSDIECIFIDHRLDDHRIVTADNYAPNGNRTGLASMYCGICTDGTINGLSGCWNGLHIQKTAT
jgi:hypothetical protein